MNLDKFVPFDRPQSGSLIIQLMNELCQDKLHCKYVVSFLVSFFL